MRHTIPCVQLRPVVSLGLAADLGVACSVNDDGHGPPLRLDLGHDPRRDTNGRN
jgi:hypothetical protein